MPVTINGSTGLTGVAAIDNVSSTELGYVDGVTSAIQTQLNAKAADSSQGLYLVTPSSTANSGGSVTVTGGAVAFSNVSSISLNGVFTSTYDNYRIVIYGNALVGVTSVTMRMRASGSDATGSNYSYQEGAFASTSVSGSRSTGQSVGKLGTMALENNSIAVDIFRPNLAADTLVMSLAFQHNSTSLENNYTCTVHDVATAYDGITIFGAANNITGTVRVYGYKN